MRLFSLNFLKFSSDSSLIECKYWLSKNLSFCVGACFSFKVTRDVHLGILSAFVTSTAGRLDIDAYLLTYLSHILLLDDAIDILSKLAELDSKLSSSLCLSSFFSWASCIILYVNNPPELPSFTICFFLVEYFETSLKWLDAEL